MRNNVTDHTRHWLAEMIDYALQEDIAHERYGDTLSRVERKFSESLGCDVVILWLKDSDGVETGYVVKLAEMP